MLNLNEVAVFIQVVQSGSFAQAARRLGMPSNTVSRQVQQLEEHLGVRLLQRSTRKLTLTDAGRQFHDHSAVQVQELMRAAQQLTDGTQAPTGTVRVAVPADFFDFFQMDWVGDFLKTYPGVRLDFILSDAIADLIADGIDVAFRGGALPDSSLVARRLGNQRTHMAASPRYLKARGMPTDLAALKEHDCITSSRLAEHAVWRLDGPAGVVEFDVGGSFSANTAQAQLKAALAGLGICLLPSVLMSRHLRDGALEDVLPAYGRPGGGLSVVYPSRKHVPRAVTAFVDAAIGKMRDLGLSTMSGDE